MNSEETLVVPKMDITYTISSTPYPVIEYLNELVCQAFHSSWGEMGAEDLASGQEHWIFHFTREDFRKMRGTNPLGDVDDLWVSCTFAPYGKPTDLEVEVEMEDEIPAH